MPRGRPKGAKNKRMLATEAATLIQIGNDAQPLDFLLTLMRDQKIPPQIRFQAAVAAAPYCHPKLDKAAQSKKEEAAQAAKDAGAGKFATPAAPKLVVNNK